jgi:hypothetical protein
MQVPTQETEKSKKSHVIKPHATVQVAQHGVKEVKRSISIV